MAAAAKGRMMIMGGLLTLLILFDGASMYREDITAAAEANAEAAKAKAKAAKSEADKASIAQLVGTLNQK